METYQMLKFLMDNFDDYKYYIMRDYKKMNGYRIVFSTDLEECCAGTITEMYSQLVN